MSAAETKKCASCGDPYPIDTGFGFRMSKGKRIPQSYCRWCRKQKKKPQELFADAPVIMADKEETRKLYLKHYPADKAGAKRAWKFMAAKLKKKFDRDNIVYKITGEAIGQLYGNSKTSEALQ